MSEDKEREACTGKWRETCQHWWWSIGKWIKGEKKMDLAKGRMRYRIILSFIHVLHHCPFSLFHFLFSTFYFSLQYPLTGTLYLRHSNFLNHLFISVSSCTSAPCQTCRKKWAQTTNWRVRKNWGWGGWRVRRTGRWRELDGWKETEQVKCEREGERQWGMLVL